MSDSRIVISSEARNLYHWRLRDSRFPHMFRAPLRFPHLSFIPPVPYPPLWGTSFHRKEGVSTQRGGVGFLFCGEASFYLPFLLGKGDRAAALGCFRKLPA